MLFKKNCLCFKKHIFVHLKNYGTFLNYLITFILILEQFLYGCRRFLPKPQQKKLFPAHRSADNSILLSFFSISFSFICNKKRGWDADRLQCPFLIIKRLAQRNFYLWVLF